MKNPLFYAKVLLFGEYGIIQNSKGLSLPFKEFKGRLKFPKVKSEATEASNRVLRAYAENLASLSQSGEADLRFDVKRMKHDIERGLYFESNIPQGYGVGSSGALVAAFYKRYAKGKIEMDAEPTKEKIKRLKSVFSRMEAYFHGTSSGFDPLVCYLRIPLMIHSKTDMNTVGMSAYGRGKGAIFLLNSGAPGKTEPMISLFFEKLKNQGFRKTLAEEFIKYNNACVDSFMRGELGPLFDNVKALSTWAYHYLRPMIPKSLLEIWEQGIHSNDYYLKLCGSGGGGYVLGFTLDYDKTQSLLKDYHTELIYRI